MKEPPEESVEDKRCALDYLNKLESKSPVFRSVIEKLQKDIQKDIDELLKR